MNKFKVGELVEQIKNLHGNENKLATIVEILWVDGTCKVRHLHLGDRSTAIARLSDFKKVPKLKRLLLSELI